LALASGRAQIDGRRLDGDRDLLAWAALRPLRASVAGFIRSVSCTRPPIRTFSALPHESLKRLEAAGANLLDELEVGVYGERATRGETRKASTSLARLIVTGIGS